MKPVLCLIIFLYCCSAQAQDSTASHKPSTRQKIIVGGLAIQQVVSFNVQYQWWWRGNSHEFRFENDGFVNNYSLGVDKAGHFFTSYLYFHALNEVMRWGEFTPRTRLLTATILPFTWALSIEIGDGFSKDYGFSNTDLLANCFGLGYGFMQEKVPYLRNFKFKMSYYPTSYYIQNHYRGWSLTSDYRGHIYWLSFDVHNLLPKSAKRYWPPFLNIAAGYGIDKNTPQHDTPRNRQFAIGFDWNLSPIRTKNKGVHATKELLNYFHYPAPGISIVQGNAPEYKLFLLK